jgi:hypothetical protein
LVEFAALIFTGSVWPEPGQLVMNETITSNMCAAHNGSQVLFCAAPSKRAKLAAIMTHFHDSSITPPAMKD